MSDTGDRSIINCKKISKKITDYSGTNSACPIFVDIFSLRILMEKKAQGSEIENNTTLLVRRD